jgi:predicted TIM-barrel enzyme
VHSFYLDMWLGMKAKALEGISEVVDDILNRGDVEGIIITGHSMGGGLST